MQSSGFAGQLTLVKSGLQVISVVQETDACQISDVVGKVYSDALEEHALQMCKK